jgi:hypothetical protein
LDFVSLENVQKLGGCPYIILADEVSRIVQQRPGTRRAWAKGSPDHIGNDPAQLNAILPQDAYPIDLRRHSVYDSDVSPRHVCYSLFFRAPTVHARYEHLPVALEARHHGL